MSSTDRIEKVVELKAPQGRVWNAIADAKQFGEWFRLAFDGAFAAGQPIHGQNLWPGYERFDQVPADRRAEAWRMNDQGWSGQAENVRSYVEK